MTQMLAPASANDVAFMQAHTTALTKRMAPRLAQAKQVHAAAGPVCTVAPAVTGTLTIGQVQTCSSGTWLNAPAFTYQWRRNRVDIPTANVATYTLTATDTGFPLECIVTGTNGGGATNARSNVILGP
jgi:hypothetical protein